jgi:hypothetical protein
MDGIPPPRDTDAEDVVWALQTAEALWKRNERGDAIVWVRRAAQAAGMTSDDDRALVLARGAAELTDLFAKASAAQHAPGREEGPDSAEIVDVEVDAEIESLLRSSQVDAGELVPPVKAAPPVRAAPPVQPSPEPEPEPVSLAPVSIQPMSVEPVTVEPVSAEPATINPVSAEPASVGPVSLESEALVSEAVPMLHAPEPSLTISVRPDEVSSSQARPSVRVPSAAESHAGMLDPWSEAAAPKPAPSPKEALAGARPLVVARSDASPAADSFDDEVVTSARFEHKASDRVVVMAPVASVSASSELRAEPAKPPPLRVSKPQMPPAARPAKDRTAPRPSADPRPRSAPRAVPRPVPAVEPPPVPPEDAPSLLATETTALPIAEPAAPRLPPEVTAPHAASEAPASPVPSKVSAASGTPPVPVALDLTVVEAFVDLPDDARDGLARAAQQGTYERGRSVGCPGLAFVLRGEVHVLAAGVATHASTLGEGAVLRTRGTLDAVVPLELVGASERCRVATWDEAAVEAALGACPWVEDDLRASGDRIQALAGATLGPLGERLSPELRSAILGRLTTRMLGPHEVLVTQGAPLPGILLVGAGQVELLLEERVIASVDPGSFVLPNESLSPGPSPNGARAGAMGALLLAADRHLSQELFATEPLLLELFAGW